MHGVIAATVSKHLHSPLLSNTISSIPVPPLQPDTNLLQGGTAAIAAPVMHGPLADMIVSTIGDSILVELSMEAGFKGATSLANDLVFDGAIKQVVPIHSRRLETTGVKTMTITLKYKHVVEDAALGFFRSSMHQCVPHAGLLRASG